MGLLLLAMLAGSSLAFPQPAQLQSVSTSPSSVQVVTLGNSAVALDGIWKFEPGDSPWVDGAPEWAQPGFDDSRWALMDLHSGSAVLDQAYGNGGYLTGWTARGFHGLWGFAWYRLRVRVAGSGGRLWLKMPDHVDDSYQVYANGRYVGELGTFSANGVKCYRTHPLIFELPEPDARGELVLTIRFYMEPWVAVSGSTGDSGGMHQAPVLGLEPQIKLLLEHANDLRVLNQIVSAFVGFLMLAAAAGALRIYLLDRGQTTYLWLAAAFVFGAALFATTISALFTYALTQSTGLVMLEGSSCLGLACWIFFWRKWFDLGRSRWIDPLIVLCVAVVTVATCTAYLRISPVIYFVADEVRTVANLLLGAMLFVAVAQGARKDRAGALFALTPVILVAIAVFGPELINWFHIRSSVFLFGVTVTVSDLALLLMVLVVGALTSRRFLNTQVEQRLAQQEVEQEMEQARELQQRVLIPEPVESAMFRVETEYHPAQTVGGDFFQTLTRPDGTLLVVVGDVSGKGVSAAMLVAVLVGAIRTRADESFDPASMLAMLNQRLLGRSGGHFATCVAAEISADGKMRIANAGHLPPYLNGRELALEGSLPLGLAGEAEWPVQELVLGAGDRLTFMTDGVVEATNRTKEGAMELFGFERTREISGERASAIAERAQRFGQEDDITVISVSFAEVAAVV
jgi:hypothetical protein